MTAKQAAERIGVSLSMVYELCKENRLPHYRVGAVGRRGKVIIDDDGVRQFLETCRVEKPQESRLRWIK